MEELILQQEITYELIKKIGINFKKAPKARLTKGYIQTRIETLTQYWDQFRTVHLQISKSVSVKDKRELAYFTEDWFDAGEEEYLNNKTDLQDHLESLCQPTTQKVYEKSHQEVKLPQINIPQFSGSYNDWSTFRDIYTSLIHENKSLSNVQKLHYLKSSISGEAEQLLKHIPVTESSYESAWTTLSSRYNNKRIIVNSILNKFLTQKKLSTGVAKGVKDLLDTTNECLNNLKSNEVSTENWDILIIHLIVSKLDDESHKSWEEEIGSIDINILPTLPIFLKFLETRFRVLEMVQPSPATKEKITTKPKSFVTNMTSSDTTCGVCGGSHATYSCEQLAKLGVQERVQHIQKSRLCFNCLSPKHSAKHCKSKNSCKQCHRRHHTLLHFPSTSYNTQSSNTTPPSISTRRAEEQTTPAASRETYDTIRSHLVTQGQNALMATALINVQTGKGLQLVRVLIDPCSQESFISEETAHRLQLKRKPVEGQVTGVDQMTARINYAIETQLHSRNNNFTLPCTAFVVKQVTDILPAKRVSYESWEHLRNLSLADPTFYQPGSIHMLLGVNIYTEILMSGVIRGEPGTPVAQQTHFGWIISGGVLNQPNEREIVSLHLNMSLDLNVMLQKFWETESLETEEKGALTPSEIRAEEIYNNTVRREPDGRYVVALPFKRDVPVLPAKSRDIALKRLRNLEKRLSENEKLRDEYNAVMREYIDLKHMEPVNECKSSERAVYLPHHAVIREDKETTRVRVVFNASQKGENGVSLNDELLIGPSLQEELRYIILRWRTFKIGFVADIIKMYRQILVRREDVDYQRILWRFNPGDPVQEFRLLTVTFGTACAPYLAIKTLKQIAKDEAHCKKLQKAREIVNHYFYVDDCLSGSHDEETAIEVQRQLTELLRRGCFELQKWCSNSERFMNEIEPEKRTKKTEVELNKRETVKALGLTWNVKEDELQITNKVNILEEKRITKRNVLSVIASLFDPMGFLAPTIIQAKIFMQRCWILGISWDDDLPVEQREEWIKFRSQIPKLEEISIPRWIGTDNHTKSVELHGFSDASTLAYAAVIYIRVITNDEQVITSLLKAKTKVAPLKQTTLPRLELCAAVLLSKLLLHVAEAMKIYPENTYAWSDSKVVLAWIKGDPSRWNPYVRNRVIEIDNNIHTTWSYVGTKENPADPATRGVAPETLKNNKLWWNGPIFLQEKKLKLHTCEIPDTDLEKREKKICAATTVDLTRKDGDDILTLMKRYSSLKKLLVVVAWIRRWLHLKKKRENIRNTLPAFITHHEREEALTVCIKITQRFEFPDDIDDLSNGKPIRKGSRLSSLTPFLDEKGVLRVGGRLKHADIEYLSKHPMIISKDNVLLSLILLEAHERTLHGGPLMMLTFLRQRYWLIDAGNTVKRFARNCMRCARQRTATRTQLMGELPECRVKPSRPFSITGVDFAGPINTRMSKGRGSKSHKSYIAIFVCMVTKALHIELVSDMTTDAFLAAYRRLVSRRGICKEIWSDHGTTFVAASKELVEMWKQGKACIPDELAALLDKEGTKWKYIPPGSPNFGGLWEASVKSIKFHLKRTIGDSTLTFEELNTLLTQIEACLNSRPLSPLSDDPRDLEPLTPAHFLIGEPLVSYPERDITDMNLHCLSRWQLIQRMTQTFWRKWQSEYLSRLQQRPKWRTPQKEFHIGDLILIKDSRYPPSKWMLGRIVAKHPGRDNLTRTYDVRTQSGVYTRTVTKLCPLPEI